MCIPSQVVEKTYILPTYSEVMTKISSWDARLRPRGLGVYPETSIKKSVNIYIYIYILYYILYILYYIYIYIYILYIIYIIYIYIYYIYILYYIYNIYIYIYHGTDLDSVSIWEVSQIAMLSQHISSWALGLPNF